MLNSTSTPPTPLSPPQTGRGFFTRASQLESQPSSPSLRRPTQAPTSTNYTDQRNFQNISFQWKWDQRLFLFFFNSLFLFLIVLIFKFFYLFFILYILLYIFCHLFSFPLSLLFSFSFSLIIFYSFVCSLFSSYFQDQGSFSLFSSFPTPFYFLEPGTYFTVCPFICIFALFYFLLSWTGICFSLLFLFLFFLLFFFLLLAYLDK